MKAKLLFILMLVVVVLAQTALAKEPPAKITIMSENLAEEIVIEDDPDTLFALSHMAMDDRSTVSFETPAEIAGEGYLLTYWFPNASGQAAPVDQMRYYPDPDGGRGYMNYLGLIRRATPYDGEWYRPNPESEAVLQAIIAEAAAESESLAAIRAAFAEDIRGALALFTMGW